MDRKGTAGLFRGILLNNHPEFSARVQQLEIDALPAGSVEIAIKYSSLNYKDALALTNRGLIVQCWPMVPGIDLAGIVERSDDSQVRAGDWVLATGCGLGEHHWGGLAERAHVPAEWLMPLPMSLSAKQAMAIGTAGFTAMLCVLALEQHDIQPKHGEILVTGATGGVGSLSIMLLANLGYRVVAVTGKLEHTAYLLSLGAQEVMSRNTLNQPGKALQKARWAGVVDSVGSYTLANACAQTQANGVVAACGLAQGMDFPATVAPFILRGVTLCGINSVLPPRHLRSLAWQRLATELDLEKLDSITQTIGLAQCIEVAEQMLASKTRGRTVVDINL